MPKSKKFIIWLFEFITVGLELSLICGKSLVKTPTDYAKIVAEDAIQSAVRFADRIMARMNKSPAPEVTEADATPWDKPANDNEPGSGTPSAEDLFGGIEEATPPSPPRRGRGRPASLACISLE